jgi:monoterpene epsilon-lactone hydrolase
MIEMEQSEKEPLKRALELWPQVWPAHAEPTLDDFRERFEEWSADNFPIPGDVETDEVDAGGVAAQWITTDGRRQDTERTIFYMHGGSFSLGSVGCYTALVSRLARACEARALVPEYRLAPEHPFPAAIEDARAAYRWLLESGTDPGQVVIMGDSAGANLALAATLALRDSREVELPAAVACLSPLTDLEMTGETIETNASLDPVISRATLEQIVPMYLGEADPKDPLASPLHADFKGFPPLLIQVGAPEVLLDDAVRVANRAKQAGVEVVLDVADDMPHIWHLFADFLPEAQDAILRLAEFVKGHTAMTDATSREASRTAGEKHVSEAGRGE